jgi:CHRD domain
MRSRTVAVSLVVFMVVVLAFASCGGGTKTVTTTAPTTSPTPPGVSKHVGPPPVKSVSYSVSLSGAAGVSSPRAPAGEPNGSGFAAISVNASTGELCWKFSQLKNVTRPTVARIYRAASLGSFLYGFRLGHTYKSSGCLPENPIFLGLLGARPQEFYVSIHSARFPEGAVRGQV